MEHFGKYFSFCRGNDKKENVKVGNSMSRCISTWIKEGSQESKDAIEIILSRTALKNGYTTFGSSPSGD